MKLDGDLTFSTPNTSKNVSSILSTIPSSELAEEKSITISVVHRNSKRIPGFMSEERPRSIEGRVGKPLAV